LIHAEVAHPCVALTPYGGASIPVEIHAQQSSRRRGTSDDGVLLKGHKDSGKAPRRTTGRTYIRLDSKFRLIANVLWKGRVEVRPIEERVRKGLFSI
jgi:hypothetical protein